MSKGARLGGFATLLEQLHSSEVIAKDTSSLTMFDSILPGALEFVSAGEPPAPAPACGRGPEAGRWCKRWWSSTPFQVVHFLELNSIDSMQLNRFPIDWPDPCLETLVSKLTLLSHFLEDDDVCLFVILPEDWKQISLSVVTFLRAENRKQ